MIVPDKGAEAAVDMKSDDPPPTYSPSRSEDPQTQTVTLPKVKPCNYLSLTRQVNSIKGSFVIDAALRIPKSLLPPLEDGETEEDRKNLKLVSSHGWVDVEIYLIAQAQQDGETTKVKPRTTLFLKSENGSVTAKLREQCTGTSTSTRNPFHLTATCDHGSVTLHLPRSFHGLLTITTRDGVSLSDSLSEHVVTFSEINNTRKCFVGDLSSWGDDGDEWKGDEVIVGTRHGKVKLQFVDEVVAEPVKSKGNLFFARILGN